MKKYILMLSILLCAQITSLQAVSKKHLYLKNNVDYDITVHCQAKHLNKSNKTRHDEATLVIKVGESAKFYYEGYLQIFELIKTSNTSKPKKQQKWSNLTQDLFKTMNHKEGKRYIDISIQDGIFTLTRGHKALAKKEEAPAV